MCFSVTASFNAAAILAIIGALCLYHKRPQVSFMFAAIPLLFGIQQFIEGFVWLDLARDIKDEKAVAAHLFLAFAFVLWPTWIPLSIRFMETDNTRKAILTGLSIFGALFSVNLLRYISQYNVSAQIIDQHILYNFYVPDTISQYGLLFFAIATLLPFAVASQKYLNILGLILTASLLFSYYVWKTTFVSMWCFTVALLSVLILFFIKQKKKKS
jgi:hypothetical protein